MTDQDRIYEGLRQENIRLKNQVQDLTRELRSIIAARTPPTWTLTGTAPNVPAASHSKVTATAAGRQTPE